MRDTTDSDAAIPDDRAGGPALGGGSGVLTGTARLHADRSAARRARALVGEWLTSWWGEEATWGEEGTWGQEGTWGPETLAPPGRAHLRDRLAVVLSELVSNAVVHGQRGRGPDGPPQLEVELHEFGSTVRLVVADRTRRPGQPAFRPPTTPALPPVAADSGRGLFIVDQLADIWHAQPMSDGLVVWCDFALDGRPLRAG